MTKSWKLIAFIALLVLSAAVLAVQSVSSNKLKIIACDVGQGDGFLITYKSTQIIIDGGPNNKIVGCISNNTAFWDREIELVVLTHPQLDHYLGLIEIFRTYHVQNFLANNLDSSANEYQVLINEVESSDTRVILPHETSAIRVGLIQLDILGPNKEFINLKSSNIAAQEDSKNAERTVLGTSTTDLDPNEFSISTLLIFRNYKALFTGDISPKKSDEVAQILQKMGIEHINYIKVPHHGSKNGLTENLLKVSRPDVAVISAGKNNSYGHPHKLVLDMLQEYKVIVRRTDLEGDVVVVY